VACKSKGDSNPSKCLEIWLVGNADIQETFGESNYFKAIKIDYSAILKDLQLLTKAPIRMPLNGLVGNPEVCKTNGGSNPGQCLKKLAIWQL
jgi:hypothetical protein